MSTVAVVGATARTWSTSRCISVLAHTSVGGAGSGGIGQGTEDSVRDAVEYSQHAVPGRVHDAPVAGVAQSSKHLLAFGEGGHGPWLVVAHQAAIAGDIGAQDR